MANFVTVAKIKDIPLGGMKVVNVSKDKIVIANLEGRFYAVSGICPHKEAPLDQGFLEGKILTCPWHGASFNITSGKVLSLPATSSLKTYKIKIKSGEIKVKI